MSKLNIFRLFALFFLLPTFLFSQKLPEQFRFSPDGRRLVIGGVDDLGLYDSATIRTIYLEFKESNYWTLLTNNYATKKDLLCKMTLDGVVYDSIGARFRGQTSYQMAGNSQKKSFDITSDIVRPDQKFMGYKNINLMNCFQDPSFLRDVFYKHQIRKQIPAAKANFTQLYINGQPWGIYQNIQQQNKDYLEEWFLSNDGANWRCDKPAGSGGGGGGMWGDGTAALNWLGVDTAKYQQNYTLKNNDTPNPWPYLVNTCGALNNTATADLPNVLPKFLDIDRTLWFLANEVAFSDDDGYIFKGKMDYFVYFEPETGRLTPLEYDGNSVMEPNTVNWSAFYNETKVNYPLMNKMLKVPAWRQRYLAHLRTIIDENLDPISGGKILDNYKLQIDSLVKADPKKLYTYANFGTEVTALKTWLTNRKNFLLTNAEVKQTAPTIEFLEMKNEAGEVWKNPKAGEKTWVTSKVVAVDGISQVNLFYAPGFVGNFTATQIFDDGQHRDGAAGDGVFGGSIPSFPALSFVRFYVEAVSANATKSASYFPKGAEHDVFIFKVEADATAGNSVTINEIMATNTKTAADQDGQFDDWIELFNTSDQPADLGGWFISDNPQNFAKWIIPAGTIVPGNGYLMVWCDEDGTQTGLHANFKLSGNGESVFIVSPDSIPVQQVDFQLQTPDKSFSRIPNGTGNFIIKDATFGFNNELVSATGEAENFSFSLKISPNPTAGLVNIETDAADEQVLQVVDLLGKTVLETEIFKSGKVDLSGQAAGVYFFKIGKSVSRVVLEK